MELILPTIHEDLVFTAIARASSNSGAYFISVIEITNSWVPGLDFKSLPTLSLSTITLELLLAEYDSCY